MKNQFQGESVLVKVSLCYDKGYSDIDW